jgi:flavin reductase (DIM6/NTAB) family NADH-FMN oxidoreductase RutF
VSIHSEHPFATPEAERDPVRRFRGRLAAPVTVWATGAAPHRVGLTVSSMLVAEGDPPELVGLINSDSDLAEWLTSAQPIAVSVLGWPHRHVADAFAGMAPSPGGPFRSGEWRTTEWGPILEGAVAWAGGHLIVETAEQPIRVGWSLLARVRIEWLEVGDRDANSLALLRGSYHSIGR